MARKGFKRNFAPLQILRPEEAERIKAASLDILKGTGMRIEHRGALEMLATDRKASKAIHLEFKGTLVVRGSTAPPRGWT
jgi:trimethylamine:corrinoid methyltransferase-like protein